MRVLFIIWLTNGLFCTLFMFLSDGLDWTGLESRCPVLSWSFVILWYFGLVRSIKITIFKLWGQWIRAWLTNKGFCVISVFYLYLFFSNAYACGIHFYLHYIHKMHLILCESYRRRWSNFLTHAEWMTAKERNTKHMRRRGVDRVSDQCKYTTPKTVYYFK